MADDQYDGLIAAAAEAYRPWIGRMVDAVGGSELGEREQLNLEIFLTRVRRFWESSPAFPYNVLSAAMSILDGEDYEKRPWEDDSDIIYTVLEYCDSSLETLLEFCLELDEEFTASKAAKWLPKYIWEPVELLARHLVSPMQRVRWWSAIHLSRFAPSTPGLLPVLLEAMNGSWMSSARVQWCFGLSGRGEAAEAIGRLGDAGREALPELVRFIGRQQPKYVGYDEQLAARAVQRLAGADEALVLLATFRESKGIAKVIAEIEQEGEASPDSPRHACFVARFLWREGEDDYWKHARPDGRGAV